MKNSELYREEFVTRMIDLFPKSKAWFEQEQDTTQAVDVEGLMTTMGFQLIQKDLGTESRSKLVGNVMYLNSNISKEAQRYDIAYNIGLFVVSERKSPKKAFAKPTGEPVKLPKKVVKFLKALNFQPLSTNSLADAFKALDEYVHSNLNDENDPIKKWYEQDDAEAQLANAYLHDFK